MSDIVTDNIRICKEALEYRTMNDFWNGECLGILCVHCAFKSCCDDDATLEEIKETARNYLREHENSMDTPFTKEVVFKIYCNDNLYELPLKVLEQMRDHLDNIIDSKTPLE